MRFMQRSLMGLFLLAVTLGLLALAAGSLRDAIDARLAQKIQPRPVRERVFTVNVVVATPVTAYPKIATFGEIRSRRTLDLRAPVAGTVIELSKNFVEGGRVRKGALLVRLDPASARSALGVAQNDITQAQAELTEARAAILLANDELSAARAQQDLRRAALERQKNLAGRGVGTAAAVETAALAEAAARQMVLAKRQALALANARVTRAKTSLARQNLRLKDARRRFQDTKIFAEFDGVLSDVTLVQGGLVSPNQKLARLIDPKALEVVFRVSNAQFARLAETENGGVGGKVEVALDLLVGDVSETGTIERVSAEVGAGRTGRQIFARLPVLAKPDFLPGDFVSLKVDEPAIANVAILPATAVDSAGRILVLDDKDRLEEVTVSVLRKQGDTVILRGAGLFGRTVVETRSALLGAGIRVKPVAREPVAAVNIKPGLIVLTAERRKKLLTFIMASKSLPKDRRDRILIWLKKDKVPAAMVDRIESRMGG